MRDRCEYVFDETKSLSQQYDERRFFAKTLRENGVTYRLIAAYLGVSGKRARQIVLGNRIPRMGR